MAPGDPVEVTVDVTIVALNDNDEPVVEEKHIEVKGVEAGEEEVED